MNQAINDNNLQKIFEYIDAGCPMNFLHCSADECLDRYPPVIQAIRCRNLKLVQLFVSYGARLSSIAQKQDLDEGQHYWTIKKTKVIPCLTSFEGFTPLLTAVESALSLSEAYRDYSIIEYILEETNGSDIDIPETIHREKTAIHFARERDDKYLIELLKSYLIKKQRNRG